jgi:ABC-type sugar transport system ATPase subunit
MASIALRGIDKGYGQARLFEQLGFEVADGEFVVIIGPSGCGKSTLLRIIAGIETIDDGTVLIGDSDVSTKHPGDRDVAMVFQDYALYPHMTVEQNLSFGLRARHERSVVVREKVARTAEALGLGELLKRRPSQLSGGQRQRVALGRAMIRAPRAYLMDEPLSNLDAHLRVQMRAELIEFHRRTAGTILYVTHDQAEAMTMGERIAVMSHGRFAQIGSPELIYRRPADMFVAGFLGSPQMNFVKAVAQPREGVVNVTAGDLVWEIDRKVCPGLDGDVTVGFRPEAVSLSSADLAQDTTTAAQTVREVNFIEHLGHELVVHLRALEGIDTGLVARTHSAGPAHSDHGWVCTILVGSISIFGSDGSAVFHGDAVAGADGALDWSAGRR